MESSLSSSCKRKRDDEKTDHDSNDDGTIKELQTTHTSRAFRQHVWLQPQEVLEKSTNHFQLNLRDESVFHVNRKTMQYQCSFVASTTSGEPECRTIDLAQKWAHDDVHGVLQLVHRHSDDIPAASDPQRTLEWIEISNYLGYKIDRLETVLFAQTTNTYRCKSDLATKYMAYCAGRHTSKGFLWYISQIGPPLIRLLCGGREDTTEFSKRFLAERLCLSPKSLLAVWHQKRYAQHNMTLDVVNNINKLVFQPTASTPLYTVRLVPCEDEKAPEGVREEIWPVASDSESDTVLLYGTPSKASRARFLCHSGALTVFPLFFDALTSEGKYFRLEIEGGYVTSDSVLYMLQWVHDNLDAAIHMRCAVETCVLAQSVGCSVSQLSALRNKVDMKQLVCNIPAYMPFLVSLPLDAAHYSLMEEAAKVLADPIRLWTLEGRDTDITTNPWPKWLPLALIKNEMNIPWSTKLTSLLL